jgi:hypothetical protein
MLQVQSDLSHPNLQKLIKNAVSCQKDTWMNMGALQHGRCQVQEKTKLETSKDFTSRYQ